MPRPTQPRDFKEIRSDLDRIMEEVRDMAICDYTTFAYSMAFDLAKDRVAIQPDAIKRKVLTEVQTRAIQSASSKRVRGSGGMSASNIVEQLEQGIALDIADALVHPNLTTGPAMKKLVDAIESGMKEAPRKVVS